MIACTEVTDYDSSKESNSDLDTENPREEEDCRPSQQKIKNGNSFSHSSFFNMYFIIMQYCKYFFLNFKISKIIYKFLR